VTSRQSLRAKLAALVLALALAGVAAPTAGAEPFFVDLAPVANTAREDDGIAGNGKGGWADEGVNDMFIYPPVATGAVVRNGYRFFLIDPAASNGRDLLLLKGSTRITGKPASATVAVPSVRARYLYVLQNAVGSAAGQPANYRVATYTVTFADGTTAEIPVRDGIEIRQWWAGQWWDNSGRASWPIFMGQNFYSMKWKKCIGIWAMQWENPSPDKPIASLTFRSEGHAAPAIWAVTLADEDFYEPESRRKQIFARPPEAPAGYFRVKIDTERRAVLAAATAEKRLQGVRRVDVIRRDLLALTVDNALGGIGPGDGVGIVDAYQTPTNFWVVSTDDPDARMPVRPVRVGRQSREAWRGDIATFPVNTLYEHAFYLDLPHPLRNGCHYRIGCGGLASTFRTEIELAYDEQATVTPAIKINQGGYTRCATNRYAYLGWWAGDLGKVDYGALRAFTVLDETDGHMVFTGDIRLRAAADVRSGEDVYELDLAPLRQPGRYHIAVPGLGRSDTFSLGLEGLRSLYQDTGRAFFHQRCGQELRLPWTSFARPACHLEVYASGRLVGSPNGAPKAGEEKKSFHGGYHDAGDDDVFAYHLRATAQWMAAFEQYPHAFRDGDLNIPESGNGIPDLLDEAAWALSFYHDNQQADGGIPLGRGNEQDSQRDWERDHAGQDPPFGVFPPTEMSCTEYAAVAAQFSRLIQPFDAARATAYTASARRAYAWALAHPDVVKEDRGQRMFRAWAAGELWAATGDAGCHDAAQDLCRSGAFTRTHWKMTSFSPICMWACAASPRADFDPALRADLRKALVRMADQTVACTAVNPYRMGHDGKAALGWGNGNGGGYYADALLRAWWLTGDRKYLNAASLNADFQLGANPLSKGFVTGIGSRHPVQPQLNAALYAEPKNSGDTVRGITVYGLASGQPPGYPVDVPLYRHWRDIHGGAEVCSEFTITETIGASAMLYAALYAEDQKTR